MASFHKNFTIETIEEDEKRVSYDETFIIEQSLNTVEMELTNDAPDMWVKGVETQETAFKNLPPESTSSPLAKLSSICRNVISAA